MVKGTEEVPAPHHRQQGIDGSFSADAPEGFHGRERDVVVGVPRQSLDHGDGRRCLAAPEDLHRIADDRRVGVLGERAQLGLHVDVRAR